MSGSIMLVLLPSAVGGMGRGCFVTMFLQGWRCGRSGGLCKGVMGSAPGGEDDGTCSSGTDQDQDHREFEDNQGGGAGQDNDRAGNRARPSLFARLCQQRMSKASGNHKH